MSVDFIEGALSQMIRDAAMIAEIEEIIVSIPKGTATLRKSIDNLNMKYSELFEVVTG